MELADALDCVRLLVGCLLASIEATLSVSTVLRRACEELAEVAETERFNLVPGRGIGEYDGGACDNLPSEYDLDSCDDAREPEE